MKIFVYGTLKRNEPNHCLFDDTRDMKGGSYEFIGVAKTVLHYPLVIASRYNIPFMLPAEGKGNKVIGEVYEVDERMMESLDELECHPRVYQRHQIQVLMTEGETTMDCQCYFLMNFKEELLDLTFYDNYTSDGPLPFFTKSQRLAMNIPMDQIWSEVKNF